MRLSPKELRPVEAGRGPLCAGWAALLTTVWFGLVAGWLELGLVLALGAIRPRASMDALRTNRHFVWMIPVSDALIFSVAGLAIALLARSRPRLACGTALRLPVVLLCWGLVLHVEGLHAIAGLLLACGLAAVIGYGLSRRAGEFLRFVRLSVPVLAASLIVFTGVTYIRVASAEQRALARCPRAKAGAPNVLLIVLDTVRASCSSLYGHHRRTTPNLERLAHKGIVFTEARATAPWTGPTHASLLTGRWPHELSVAPDVPLDDTFPTLAEVLAGEGYATAGFVGNIYMCNAIFGFSRGFARYEDAYENQTISLFETVWSSGLGKRVIQGLGGSTELDDGETLRRKTAAMLNRDVLGWLAGRPAGQPYFAFINYYDVHRPYILHAGVEPRYGMAALPLDEQRAIDKRYLDLAAGKPIPAGFTHDQIGGDAYTLFHDSYDSCIAYVDRQLGLLLAEMERRGLLENTLVIVTSDHGEQLGERGLVAHGASVYRQEVHVPLLVIPPCGATSPHVVKEPVSLREVPATVAEWVKLGPHNPFPGRSLTRFVDDDGTDRLRGFSRVLCELEHNVVFPGPAPIPFPFGPARCLVSRDRVYIRREDGGEELYDLWNDPQESDDLAKLPQSRPVLDAFRAELSRFRRGATSPPR